MASICHYRMSQNGNLELVDSSQLAHGITLVKARKMMEQKAVQKFGSDWKIKTARNWLYPFYIAGLQQHAIDSLVLE